MEKYIKEHITTTDGRKLTVIELKQITDERWNEIARAQKEDCCHIGQTTGHVTEETT